ncbi:Terminase-like family protein [Bradyrhizobium erythrophlei]|nr:Terminase-like family protein [Bradyrhizobium erythrophlei]
MHQPPSPYRQLAYALDPVLWAQEVLGFEADDWQKVLLRTSERQAILNNSRQSGKSVVCAIKGLHKAIFSPDSLVLLVSPSLRQSKELFGKVTGFLKSLQPAQILEEDNRLSCTLENGSRICSLPGDPKNIRGFSAPAMILEDESAWVSDELFGAIKPMLAVSRGQLILMSTPFGRRGHFFDTWQSGGDAWQRISVPATDCPRISKEFLDQERASMSEWRFRQEYMCEFVETVDQIFSYDVIRAAFDPAVTPLFSSEEIVRMAAGAAA